MRDHDDGVRLARVIDGGADLTLADVVERGGSLVENEDGGIFQKHARECNALTLPTGKISAALGQRGLVTLRHLQNLFVDMRLARGFLNLFGTHGAAAVADVFSHGAGEDKRSLADVTDAFADVFARKHADWHAADENFSTTRDE